VNRLHVRHAAVVIDCQIGYVAGGAADVLEDRSANSRGPGLFSKCPIEVVQEVAQAPMERGIGHLRNQSALPDRYFRALFH